MNEEICHICKIPLNQEGNINCSAVHAPQSTWEQKLREQFGYMKTKFSVEIDFEHLVSFISEVEQKAEERGRKTRVEEVILAENEEIKIIKEQTRKAERTALREWAQDKYNLFIEKGRESKKLSSIVDGYLQAMQSVIKYLQD